VPSFAQPLVQIYANVAQAAAEERADSSAHARADSLRGALRDAVQGRAVAKRLGLMTLSYSHVTGDRDPYPTELHPYYQRLETLKPGQILPLTREIGGNGYAVTWVDSISPPGPPTWERNRDRALEAYRAEAGFRALQAKQAELDSLMQAGWSFDSVGVAWGGLQHADDIAPGQRIPGIGTFGVVDTLLYGLKGTDGLPPGKLSDWVTLPAGVVRLRTGKVRPPDATTLTTRMESERRVESERALGGYFEELKKRYPVRILDRSLADVALPQPPPNR
jgi:hypothetical protein